MDTVFATDDLFLSTFAFPCGPWNPLTQFNIARSEDTREHWERIRAEHMPTLWWIADTARSRIAKGRLVLLEQGWRCLSLKLKCFVDLIDMGDRVDDDAYFQFVRGDGCEVGLNDWETKTPMRGATAWGINSITIKEVLAHLCSAPEEEHQPIQASRQAIRAEGILDAGDV